MRNSDGVIIADDGATAIEYGLIAAIMGAALVAGMTAMGTGISDALTLISTEMSNAWG